MGPRSSGSGGCVKTSTPQHKLQLPNKIKWLFRQLPPCVYYHNSNKLSFCLALGTWQWLDKTVMDYTNWATDEPDSDYGEINTLDGTWKSGRRWHDRAYICETAKGKMVIFMSTSQTCNKLRFSRTILAL